MRFQEHPKFGAITPQDVVLGCAKLAIIFETKLGNHIETLKSKFSFYVVFFLLPFATVKRNDVNGNYHLVLPLIDRPVA